MDKTFFFIIKYNDIIEFKCVISKDAKYFRVLKDELNYEEMIRELLHKGYKKVIKTREEIIKIDENKSYIKDIFKEEHIDINSPDDLNNFLKDDFDCELIEEADAIFEIVTDGAEFSFQNNIVSPSTKNEVSMLATELFKFTTESDYEPIQVEKHGSYAIEVKDVFTDKFNSKKLIELIKSIESSEIYEEEYLKKSYYYQFINSLIKLVSNKSLKTITFKVKNFIAEFKHKDLIKLKNKIKEIYNSQKINFTSKKIRAIDFENLTFKVTYKDKTLYCKTYENILRHIDENKNKDFKLSGFYTSVKTIFIDNAFLLDNNIL